MDHTDEIFPCRVQVDDLTQSPGERGHDGLGVVAFPVEPAVDGMLHPPAQRIEQRRDDQRGHGHGHRANASAAGPPVPGWWVTRSSTTEAAPSPSATTPGQLSWSAMAAMAGSMARSRTFPKPITSAGGAAVSGWPR